MIKGRFKQCRLSLAVVAVVAGMQAQAAEDNDTTPQLNAVVVTGTRSENRTVLESMQPIQVVSSKTLQSTGSNELSEALSRLIPSLNFPRPASSGFTGIIRPVQMRGLSPDQVLVLVNGKRRHTSAFLNTNVTQGRGSAPVDLGAIPLSAIDHIEVLGDGASARYGSDAIAGVINVILKKDDEGGQVTTSYGQYSKGDGIQRHVDADTGFKLGERGSAHLSFDGNNNDFTNRAGPDNRNPGAPGYGSTTYRLGDPDITNGKVMLNAEYALSDDLTAYGFAGYNKSTGDTWDAFRNGRASTYDRAAHPEGYLPRLHAETQDQSLVLGLRGLLADWKWDASVDYGRNQIDLSSRDTLNRYLYRDTGNAQQNFNDGSLTSSLAVYQLDFSNELNVPVLSNPLSVAFGVEYQHQAYQESSGEANSYYGTGAEGFSGLKPGDSGSYRRDVVAQYLDLETNLTDKWRASVAVRHDDYNDFGGATTGSFSSRYDFNPVVAVRGSVSTGYRAPSLAQQHYSATTSALNTSINAYQDQLTASVDSPIARLLGAEDLKAEKSRNISLGLVLQPTDDFSATLDVYQININDRVTLSSNLNVQTAAGQAYLAANGIPTDLYQSVRYFTNAVDTQTRGVDITGQHRYRFDNGGRLNSTVGYSYAKTRVTDIKDNPTALAQSGLNLDRIDRRDRYGVLTDSTPRSKLSFSTDYSKDNWGLHANLVRYGSFLAVSNTGPAYDQRFDAKWVLDLSTSYRYTDWLFTVGGDNVTDAYPDKRNSLNNPGHQNVNYISYSPFGMNGAFYYLKATYSW